MLRTLILVMYAAFAVFASLPSVAAADGQCVILPNSNSNVSTLGKGIVLKADNVCDSATEGCGACLELCNLFDRVSITAACEPCGTDGYCNDFSCSAGEDPDCQPPATCPCFELGDIATYIPMSGDYYTYYDRYSNYRLGMYSRCAGITNHEFTVWFESVTGLMSRACSTLDESRSWLLVTELTDEELLACEKILLGECAPRITYP